MLNCPLIIKGVTFGVTLDLYTRSTLSQGFYVLHTCTQHQNMQSLCWVFCFLSSPAFLWLSSCGGNPAQWGRLADPLQNSAQLPFVARLEPARRNAGSLLRSAAEPHSKWRPREKDLCCLLFVLFYFVLSFSTGTVFAVVHSVFCPHRCLMWWVRLLCRSWMVCKFSAPF